MNVNLVSPLENGNNFVVRFKDDIIIPERSKVYLNFASLSRENDVELYEDQTIKVVLVFDGENFVRPEFIPTPPFDTNKLFADNTFTIKSGTYNYQKLYTLITTGINGILQNAGNPADLSMYRAVALADIDNTDEQITQGNVSFSLGIMKNYPTQTPNDVDVMLDAQNFLNSDQDDGSGNAIAYRKTSINAIIPSGLNKVDAIGGGFMAADKTDYTTGGNTRSLTNGSANPDGTGGAGPYYQNIPSTSNGGGTNATFNFKVITDGIKNTGGFGTDFDASGANTNDKTAGGYTGIPLIGGSGTAATIDFDVAADGGISFATIAINNSGSNYEVDDLLTIDNGSTGGTEDTILKVASLRRIIDFNSIRCNAQGNGYILGEQLSFDMTATTGTIATKVVLTALQPSAGTAFFDNYGLSTQHYWHIGYNDDTPFDNCNIIKFTTQHSITNMLANNGCVQLGLYSSEVAAGINKVDGLYPLDSAKRTGGTTALAPDGVSRNPQILPSDVGGGAKQIAAPMVVSVDCRSATAYLKIFAAQKNNNNFRVSGLHTWTSCNHQITAMKNITNAGGHGIRIANIPQIDLDTPFSMGIQCYYDMADLNNDRVYFRVLNLNGHINGNIGIDENHKTNNMIVYDSKSAGGNSTFFPDLFFRTTDNTQIDYTTSGVATDAGGAGFSLKREGTADKTQGAYTDIPITATSGGGTGLKLNFNVGADQKVDPTSLVVHTAGDGYKVRDYFNIPNTDGVGGTADTQFHIDQLSAEPRANRVNSQMPFNIIMSALTQSDGFNSIQGPLYDKDNTKPLTFIQSYELECSEELARYINLNTNSDRTQGYTQRLYPNTGDAMNRNVIHLEGMNLDWRNESYSISLKELPIRNYKNNEKKANGGFAKTILANCPVPFSDAQSYSTKSKQMITATYKPNYQVLNNLYNQSLTTNHFSIEIRKLASDKPANEIKKSVINFTIMPPDDYKGNINSVDLISNL